MIHRTTKNHHSFASYQRFISLYISFIMMTIVQQVNCKFRMQNFVPTIQRQTATQTEPNSENNDNNNNDINDNDNWYDYWEEIPSSTAVNKNDYALLEPEPKPKPPRRLFWRGRMQDSTWIPDEMLSLIQKEATTSTAPINDPHPLRTDVWNVTINWTGNKETHKRMLLFPLLKARFKQKLELEFHRNGYVQSRLTTESYNKNNHNYNQDDPDRKQVLGVGKWELKPWGISFTIPGHTNEYVYRFTAEVTLNPFGKHAKFLRGIVLRERVTSNDILDQMYDELGFVTNMRYQSLKWFRPVVGTFSGIGVGEDTVDWS